MAKKNVIVKSDLRKNLPDVAAFLRELADKVETGTVTLVQGGQDVVIDLPETVSFELEYYEHRTGVDRRRQKTAVSHSGIIIHTTNKRCPTGQRFIFKET
jgi:amphi-Trp domain-containing protein